MLALALTARLPANAQIYISDIDAGTVGVFSMSGAPINRGLITGLNRPNGLVLDGSGRLFVASLGNGAGTGTIGTYTTAGATINPSFISGLDGSWGFTFDERGHVFVSSMSLGTVAEYSASGQLINPALISGLSSPSALAYDHQGHLFVANYWGGTIGQYTVSGAPINPTLISGLTTVNDIELDGQGNMYVLYSLNTVGKFTTAGATIDSRFIWLQSQNLGAYATALDGQGHLFATTTPVTEYSTTSGAQVPSFAVSGFRSPCAITVAVPEPSLMSLAAIALVVLRCRRYSNCPL